MNLKILFLVIYLTTLNFIIKSQNEVSIKLKIELIHYENSKNHLKNCTVKISKNNTGFKIFKLSSHNFQKKITSKGIYKFELSHEGYVSKYFTVDAKNIPKKKIAHRLKAEISLFKYNEENQFDFLKKEPVSIAYYDYTKKKLIWDFEYNRVIRDKIIEAQISK